MKLTNQKDLVLHQDSRPQAVYYASHTTGHEFHYLKSMYALYLLAVCALHPCICRLFWCGLMNFRSIGHCQCTLLCVSLSNDLSLNSTASESLTVSAVRDNQAQSRGLVDCGQSVGLLLKLHFKKLYQLLQSTNIIGVKMGIYLIALGLLSICCLSYSQGNIKEVTPTTAAGSVISNCKSCITCVWTDICSNLLLLRVRTSASGECGLSWNRCGTSLRSRCRALSAALYPAPLLPVLHLHSI